MRKKKSSLAIIIRSSIFIAMALIIFYQNKQLKTINSILNNITILDVDSDSLVAYSGLAIKSIQTVITPQYVNQYMNYSSPFADGKSFSELLKKYVHYKSQDLYGARRKTGDFRRIHEGIDFFVAENTPVYPIADFGIVTQIEENPHFLLSVDCKDLSGKPASVKVEYGKIVRILYPEGIETVYAHLNEIFVKEGDFVNRKTKVGVTGVTGNLKRSGKASHLHLELRDSERKSFNPKERLYYNKADFNKFIKLIETK